MRNKKLTSEHFALYAICNFQRTDWKDKKKEIEVNVYIYILRRFPYDEKKNKPKTEI